MNEKNCSSRGFKALMVTQFLGAWNDNVFKVILTLLVVNALVEGGEGIGHLVLINVFFVLPFILFSPLAGSIGDRFSKTKVMQLTKVAEVLIMGLAMLGIATQSTKALLGVLFLTGLQSTIFSPSKYGALPELLEDKHLSRGNGYIQFWTFIAIIGGTAVGGMLAEGVEGDPFLPGAVLIAAAVLGLCASFFISKTPPADPQKQLTLNPLLALKSLAAIRADRGLFLCLCAISYFWSVGALYQLNLALFAKQLGGWSDLATALLMAALGIGIGTGSLCAGKVSEGKVELGLVPIGAVGMALFGSVLAFTSSSYFLTVLCLIVLGLSAGFYIVPLNAYLQENSPKTRRGDFIAATNLVSFSAMLLSSFLLWFLVDRVGLSPAGVFVIVGITALFAAVFICTVLPEVLLRCVNWIIVHLVYKLRVRGAENIPAEGGALLVCNHVSFVDAPLLLAATGRPVRFLMYKPIYEQRFVKPFACLAGAIPVQGGGKRDDVSHALQAATDAIEAGDLVCIFAEGGISRIGQLLAFKRGLERIMAGSKAPIIPVHLDRLWGSIFSFKGGKAVWKWPELLPYPMTISFGTPLPPDSDSFRVRQAVSELGADAFALRHDAFQIIHEGLYAACHRKMWRPLIKDHGSKWIRAGNFLSAALALGKQLGSELKNEKMVGIYLPPSTAGALVNAALLLTGKIPVNLNYTASREALQASLDRAEISTIISARRFLEKMPLKVSDTRVLFLDEGYQPTIGRTIPWLIAFVVLPRRAVLWLAGGRRVSYEDVATIIFSSGSTGVPKGVKLTHGNITSNIKALDELFDFSESDCVLGVLPFFHSFGFTAGLWLPLLTGARLALHANPLDAAAVGRLADDAKATMLISTPTFLQSYTRRVKPEQFSSLKHVFVGAEKLKDGVRESFTERFGVVPREGYGCTELSPVAIANTEDFGEGRGKQLGTKPGSVGRALPGVALRIVNPETGELLGAEEEGLLLVKGPNVMAGYLGDEKQTAEVITDGWYNTGDIAAIDQDGFVTITDRLSRFSKIGGEMVPHVKIEEEIHRLLGATETVCAVTAVDDEKKGERLVVLSIRSLDGNDLSRQLAESGLPNLWIPRADSYYAIPELPLLGSGKLDLKKIKELAQTYSETKSELDQGNSVP